MSASWVELGRFPWAPFISLGALALSACGSTPPEPPSSPIAIPEESPPPPVERADVGPMSRPLLTPLSFRESELPLLQIGQRTEEHAPGPTADDIIMARRGDAVKVRVRPQAGTIDRITIGSATSVWRGGLAVSCNGDPALPAQWEKLQFMADGSAHYTETIGWFDPQGCVVTVQGRGTVRLTALAPGYLYAARRCESPCAGPTSIMLLAPPLETAEASELGRTIDVERLPFTRIDVEPRKGAAFSFVGRVDSARLRDLFAGAAPWGASAGADVTVGVDISQGTLEEGAVAIGYAVHDPGARAVLHAQEVIPLD